MFQSKVAPTAASDSPAMRDNGCGFVEGVAEGVVTFPSKPLVSYRFILAFKDEKLKLTLEDRKSKLQWDSGELSQDEIVRGDAVIAHASFQDYANCFCACLSNTSANSQREIVDLPENQLQVTLKLKLRVFTSSWMPSYTIALLPVALEPLHVITSRLRDQEDEIKALRVEMEVVQLSCSEKDKAVTELQAELAQVKKALVGVPSVVFAHLGATAVAGGNMPTISWKTAVAAQCERFYDLLTSGKIRFKRGAILDVFVSVVNSSSSNSEVFQLQKNGTMIRSCVDSEGKGYKHTSVLRHIFEVAANDEVAVQLANAPGFSQPELSSTLTMHVLAFK